MVLFDIMTEHWGQDPDAEADPEPDHPAPAAPETLPPAEAPRDRPPTSEPSSLATNVFFNLYNVHNI